MALRGRLTVFALTQSEPGQDHTMSKTSHLPKHRVPSCPLENPDQLTEKVRQDANDRNDQEDDSTRPIYPTERETEQIKPNIRTRYIHPHVALVDQKPAS